jgi:hypothetical protein
MGSLVFRFKAQVMIQEDMKLGIGTNLVEVDGTWVSTWDEYAADQLAADEAALD